MRMLEPSDFAGRVVPYLARAGLIPEQPTPEQRAVLEAAIPLIQERMNTLSEVVDMIGFLFADERDFRVSPDDASKVLTPESLPVLDESHAVLDALPDWTTENIEKALRHALVEGLGLKPKNAFGPVRVAVTGRRVSPPLFESLELLGRERTLHRIAQARSDAGG
jgi:glutamyl-tRNA synthetase